MREKQAGMPMLTVFARCIANPGKTEQTIPSHFPGSIRLLTPAALVNYEDVPPAERESTFGVSGVRRRVPSRVREVMYL